jgi:hypothetical protein
MASGPSNGPSLGSEAAAIHLIKKACDFDLNKRYPEALVCYREGIDLLFDSLRTIQDPKKKAAFKEKLSSYMDRAEILKKTINQMKECKTKSEFYYQKILIQSILILAGKYHEQIQIEDNATGFSYHKLFHRFFVDEILDFVEINDPYIKTRHQVITKFDYSKRRLYLIFGFQICGRKK